MIMSFSLAKILCLLGVLSHIGCIIMNFNSLESSSGKLSELCYGAIGK
jgi:hypothetical protein